MFMTSIPLNGFLTGRHASRILIGRQCTQPDNVRQAPPALITVGSLVESRQRVRTRAHHGEPPRLEPNRHLRRHGVDVEERPSTFEADAGRTVR